MHSALYEGQVRHRRFGGVEHAFNYRLFMMYLDLSELPTLFRGRWLWSARRPTLAWFRRADYLGDPAVPLDVAVRDLVEQRTGERPTGPVRMLTHLRYFGYCFNPLSLYYVFAPDGERVQSLVLEVRNTPWGERHCYVLRADDARAAQVLLRFRFSKAFHVSPFLGMDMAYHLLARPPRGRLSLHLENRRGLHVLFDATLQLRRREISGWALNGALLRFPFMTARVIGAIYWEALRLWLKGVAFQPRPAKT
ncbi:MAG TPA: DUF1365 domain-containing protein [bacterium]|nr:DUF1365 domain-containing protein [bacterium]